MLHWQNDGYSLTTMNDNGYVPLQVENIRAAYAELDGRVRVALHQHQGNQDELTTVRNEVLALAEAVEAVRVFVILLNMIKP